MSDNFQDTIQMMPNTKQQTECKICKLLNKDCKTTPSTTKEVPNDSTTSSESIPRHTLKTNSQHKLAGEMFSCRHSTHKVSYIIYNQVMSRIHSSHHEEKISTLNCISSPREEKIYTLNCLCNNVNPFLGVILSNAKF